MSTATGSGNVLPRPSVAKVTDWIMASRMNSLPASKSTAHGLVADVFTSTFGFTSPSCFESGR
jgi:hypothetical protein